MKIGGITGGKWPRIFSKPKQSVPEKPLVEIDTRYMPEKLVKVIEEVKDTIENYARGHKVKVRIEDAYGFIPAEEKKTVNTVALRVSFPKKNLTVEDFIEYSESNGETFIGSLLDKLQALVENKYL